MSFRSLILTISALVVMGTAPLAAAPIFSLAAGTLDLTVLSNPGNAILAFDIRNSAVLNVTDGVLLGRVLVTDLTPLGSPPPASPNATLAVLNTGFTESGVLLFSNPAFGTPNFVLTANYIVNTAPVTDAALASFASATPYTFSFAFVNLQTLEDGNTLSTWSLTAVDGSAVPEPGSMALTAAGMASFLLLVLRKRR